MKKKTSIYTAIVFSLLLCLSLNVKSQASIYKTFEDYKSGNAEVVLNVSNIWWKADSFGKVVVIEITGEKSKKYKLSEFWGFTYKDRLFRSMKEGYKDLVCVLDSGKFILYTHGGAQLSLLKEGNNFGFMNQGSSLYFLSLDYGSEIFHTHFNPYSSKLGGKSYKQRYTQFTEKYPQFQKVYDCIGDTYSSSEARQCIINYFKN